MLKRIISFVFTVCLITALIAIPVSASSAGGGVGDSIRPTTFTVPLKNAEIGAKVFFALYMGNALVDLQTAIYEGDAVSFRSRQIYDKIKVFVWSENGIEPLSGPLDYSQIIYGENDSIDIDIGQVEDITVKGNYITGVTYLDTEEQVSKDLSIYPGTTYYYNGVEIGIYDALYRLKEAYQDRENHYGRIKFVRCGNIGSYTNVYVTEYNFDAVVKEINHEDKEITSYIYDEVFGFNEDRVDYVFYKEDGTRGTFDDIKEDSVLSFAESTDGDLISVYISNKKVTGTLEEIIYEDDYYLYKIGGNYYKGNENYNSFFIGDEGVFYINVDNTLIYQKPIININYAYLLSAETNDSGAVSVKYMKADGTWEKSELASEITIYKGIPENSAVINLKRLSSTYSERLEETFTVENGKITAAKRQLINYKQNIEGKIDKIYLADTLYSKNYFSWDFSRSSARYSEKYKRLGSLYVKDGTKVFCVDTEKADTEDGYYVSTAGALFKDGEEYNINAYDTDLDGYPAIIIVYDAEFDIN